MLVWNKLRCDDMLPQQDELDVNGSGHYYRDCEFRDIALHMGYKIISFYETSASWQGQLVLTSVLFYLGSRAKSSLGRGQE